MIQSLGDDIFRGTAVLACVDSQPARRWIAQRCRFLGVPLVEGGFRGERWNLSAFTNRSENEPCWACGVRELETGRLFSCEAYSRAVVEAGFIPATAPGAMVLGAWMVDEVTAILHGRYELANATVFGSLGNGTANVMRRVRDPHCRLDHRLIAQDAVHLKCGPAGTVEALLDEVNELMADPVVSLPATFVRVAPCLQCHQPVWVELPEWAVSSTPVCDGCGGSFRRAPGGLPEQHGTLSAPTSRMILDTTLQTVGIGPGLHLSVTGAAERVWVALAAGRSGILQVVSEPDDLEKNKRSTPPPASGGEAASIEQSADEE